MYKIQPNTLFTGKIIKYLPTCHSTNDIAAEMIQSQEVFEGTIIITNHQTTGRGQRGNSWEAAIGQNLTLSLILKPTFLRASDQFQLNVAVSLGVHEFLSQYLPEGLTIKWSNDIYHYDKKLGGILIENTLQGYNIGYSVVGIGLNINQTQFGVATASSLSLAANAAQSYDLNTLLAQLAEKIEKYYLQIKQGYYESLKIQYLRVMYRYQEWHYFRKNGELFLGQIIGIDQTGKLAIETEDEELLYFDFKEVQFVINP